MDSRVAILDLGTNTFHLLIADVCKGGPVLIYQDTIAVKLGEGGISAGVISGKAFKRGINAIKSLKEQIDYYQVRVVRSAATSAIRTAANGDEFIRTIKSETGLDLEIITGEREAELIYLGVRAAVCLESITLIVDIGGGSVEFIICNKSEIFWKESYPIGAARMMERFHRNDPIKNEDIVELENYLSITLKGLKDQLDLYRPEVLIGSAGSFETFTELLDPEWKPSFERPESTINLERFRQLSKDIVKSTHLERSQLSAIPPVRVDMIVVATLITNYILSIGKFKSFKLSSYSLKEGILFELLK